MSKTFNKIPVSPPDTPLLDKVRYPSELRQLEEGQLHQLIDELREALLYSVGKTGGHFGAGLGVLELTVALHYLYDTPEDRLIWDVGHQTYPHKILTGRREALLKVRKSDGISGFPKRSESEYDDFGVGHSSTSISAALGMALAAEQTGSNRKVVAVIGDGAMTGGMAFEALNHAAHTKANMLVILNDNQMSISHNQGGLNTYFSRVWASKLYTQIREGGKKVLERIPPAWELARKTEEHMKGMVAPALLFEELGLNYIGPIDGHDIETLLYTIRNMRDLEGPQLLHVLTSKGKGFAPAEQDPVGYHAINKLETSEPVKALKPKQVLPKYQDVFGQWLCDTATLDEKLVGITPAMCEGSGMVEFSQKFAARFHDVAIAEQHAVTLAGGMACDGLKPVVAIYSTFLQRGYDQLIHDVALQNLDVTFGIDRAGVVGEDGATHAGSFDLTFLRCIPNMLVATPSDENECRQLLYTGYDFEGPAAIRYPRGTGNGAAIEQQMLALPIGKGVIRRNGQKVAILNFGTRLPSAMDAAENLNASVADMRFVKPIDEELILELALNHELLVTIEENSIVGGAGSAVSEYLNSQGLSVPLLQLGLPDYFMGHGKPDELIAEAGLDAAGIQLSIEQRLTKSTNANLTTTVQG